MYIFDPEKGEFSNGPDLKTGDRQRFGCALLESPTNAGYHAVLIAGGVDTSVVELFEYEYDEAQLSSARAPHWNTSKLNCFVCKKYSTLVY